MDNKYRAWAFDDIRRRRATTWRNSLPFSEP
jgi:hypothetical protein